MRNFSLTIELVPASLWGISIFRILGAKKPEQWKRIKEEIFAVEGKKCWICGREGRLDAHEFWSYDDENHVQKLEAIHHICNLCHKIKHFGFWCFTTEGRKKLEKEHITKDKLIQHFCEVNYCAPEDFDIYMREEFDKHEERSSWEWEQNFGIYEKLIQNVLFDSKDKK